MTKVHRVEGMHCDGCARSVSNAIRAKAPKANVTVDLKGGTVAVDDAIDETLIAQAVTDAGFDYRGVAR
ncbi:MAG: heavy-metal-associated domain-containing protein [Alphaproteobacteria bacterium]|nr:heavy-metal-associated domain-containing protein [Alphaproteobacteria bacterium]